MKHLIKQYLDQGISRRKLMTGLTTAGLTAVAAKSMAQSLAPFASAQAQTAAAPMRRLRGTGGALYINQLKAAGVDYIFFNPSTGDAPIFDALVDGPQIQLIKGVQEGAVIAMADGYARLSGKPGVVTVADIGLPNAMTQMVNTFKDRIPMLVTVASIGADSEGRDGPQDFDHQMSMLGPMTKWYWTASSAGTIPETTRRALKFATTPPAGPVFLALPANELRAEAEAGIMDAALFNVSMKIRPSQSDIEAAARMLIEAKNPVLSVGDEATMCQAEKEVVALAELLGIPVAGMGGFGGSWSKPFPTKHPLYLGPLQREVRFLGQVDVHINIGSKSDEIALSGARMISMRQDPTSLGRVAPVDLGLVGDIKLATADLIAAIKSMATDGRLRQIADDRTARTTAYTKQLAELRSKIIHDLSDGSPIKMERLGIELENALDKDTIYVADCDSGRTMEPLLSFGGGNKTFVATSPNVLGWGMGAAVGAKLARPDMPVVSIVGDGSFLFSGPQPLWSMARYKAPVTVMVINNRSYNNERNRIWTSGGVNQAKLGRDMTCYNGDPDVDCAKAAEAFGVEAEIVKEPEQIRPALDRAKRANVEGRPYFLDIHVQRDGVGAATAWHPAYSIADQRTRKV